MIRDLVVIIAVVGWSVTTYARDMEVGPSQVVTSISQAIKLAHAHDTLCINAGDYHPDSVLVIDKPLTLIACGEVSITAAKGSGIFEIRADSVSISGLHLKEVPRSYLKDLAAIWVDRVQHFTISNNTINNCFFAVFCTKASRGSIIDNQITGNAVEEHSSANAIHLWYCDSMHISGNRVQHHRDGIYLEFTDNSLIANNISRNNLRYGLHFMFSNHDTYKNNLFTNNGAGVAVMFSDHIDMTHNRFIENWGGAAYGLLLKEIYDSRLQNNTFQKNTVAVFAEGSNRVIMSGNTFTGNGWALKMRGSAMDNEISHNNFMGNSFDVATDASTNYNNYHHNYWDDYKGYDLDKNGIGDVPHRPVNLFSFLVTRIDESIILLRSSFIQVLDFAERIAPAVTPNNLLDENPLMKPTTNDDSLQKHS